MATLKFRASHGQRDISSCSGYTTLDLLIHQHYTAKNNLTVVLMYARGVGTFLADCCNPGHTEKHRAA